ncbi:hypothetical protein VF21_00609 [Pseudogymnoascus sp. 05NY08]|nr:hypothetical protein VF21_00609 [Pseudogymnoascus sp. 05NY08]
MDDFCFATPQATYPEWVKESTIPPFSIGEWIGVVDLRRHAWFHQRWAWQEIQLGNRNRLMRCGGSVKPWAMVRKVVMALYGRESLPRTVTGLINECYWLADIRATFGVDTILAIEQSTGTMNPIRTLAPEPMNNTGPSCTPNLKKVRDGRKWLWQVSTGVSRAEARCLDGDVLEVHGMVCGTVESVFMPDWVPEHISRLPALLQMLRDSCSHCVGLLHQGSAPGRGERVDQQEVRKLLDAALGDGYSNGPIDINLWSRLKASNQGHSLIVSDNGLIGKVGAVREMARAGNIITTVLGRNSPLLLRPPGNDSYVVVTGAMIPGLCNSASILGQLPHPWKIQLVDQLGHPEPQPHYINSETGVTTREDPRLGSLPPDWIRVQGEWQTSQPIFVDHFQNVMTGQVVHWDPRLDVDSLRDRGVAIKTFLLK